MAQTAAVKDIVTEDHRNAVLPDEFLPDDKSLGEPVGRGLHGVGKLQAELFAAAEQCFEFRRVVGSGNN